MTSCEFSVIIEEIITGQLGGNPEDDTDK